MNMKNLLKKVLKKIDTEIVWFFDRGVTEAINNGNTYEEVERLVEDIIKRNKQSRENRRCNSWKLSRKN